MASTSPIHLILNPLELATNFFKVEITKPSSISRYSISLIKHLVVALSMDDSLA